MVLHRVGGIHRYTSGSALRYRIDGCLWNRRRVWNRGTVAIAIHNDKSDRDCAAHGERQQVPNAAGHAYSPVTLHF